MAQRIQTVCDVHLERGEDVDAQTWEVLVRKAGTRTLTRELDLCGECAQTLEAVARFVAEHGRTVAPQTRKAASKVAAGEAVPASSVSASSSGDSPMAACPVEGCGSVVTVKNLGRHVRQVHGATLAELGLGNGGEPTAAHAYPCPDCDRTFTRAQGLGAHRYQAHGYVSPTRAEREERAAS